ncbi:unnamed protein product [Lepeophtheirus salmonis]|uniref:(salmon louse) hypothetical protein n=1 Tax=Lepeophtheirus salmonis TaxID=72036 RepID=A0A7R8D3I6_LEPSM|nr:unnamed protein product [Lepeophtheirus salmonis]CAF2985044.1 unnamed protein product [Lepeophtheirus salmonis]
MHISNESKDYRMHHKSTGLNSIRSMDLKEKKTLEFSVLQVSSTYHLPTPPSSFSIDTALRSLSKAVFTHAILPNDSQIEEDIPSPERTWDERIIAEAISPKLVFKSQHIQLQLAARLGYAQPSQCYDVYSRCPFEKHQLMTLIRQRGMSLNIPTSPDYDCTVIFLWKRKESKITFPSNDIDK